MGLRRDQGNWCRLPADECGRFDGAKDGPNPYGCYLQERTHTCGARELAGSGAGRILRIGYLGNALSLGWKSCTFCYEFVIEKIAHRYTCAQIECPITRLLLTDLLKPIRALFWRYS